jgi:hypothetical protein
VKVFAFVSARNRRRQIFVTFVFVAKRATALASFRVRVALWCATLDPPFRANFSKEGLHRSHPATRSANKTSPIAIAVSSTIAAIALSCGAGVIALACGQARPVFCVCKQEGKVCDPRKLYPLSGQEQWDECMASIQGCRTS